MPSIIPPIGTPPKPEYRYIQSPHRSKRRGTREITAIVIHHTGSMNIDGTINWFQMPVAKVSAHYIVGRQGQVVQMVKDEDKAWHAGRSAMNPRSSPPGEPNVNNFSIGIELVGDNDSGFTDKQLASLYALCELLIVKYKIKPERVVGHCHISPGRKIDPDGFESQFNWQAMRRIAQVAYNTTIPTTGPPIVSA